LCCVDGKREGGRCERARGERPRGRGGRVGREKKKNKKKTHCLATGPPSPPRWSSLSCRSGPTRAQSGDVRVTGGVEPGRARARFSFFVRRSEGGATRSGGNATRNDGREATEDYETGRGPAPTRRARQPTPGPCQTLEQGWLGCACVCVREGGRERAESRKGRCVGAGPLLLHAPARACFSGQWHRWRERSGQAVPARWGGADVRPRRQAGSLLALSLFFFPSMCFKTVSTRPSLFFFIDARTGGLDCFFFVLHTHKFIIHVPGQQRVARPHIKSKRHA
jgi:hypothetical protein